MNNARPDNPGFFHHYVEAQKSAGRLICQPRMGFSDFKKMRRGLEAVRGCGEGAIGTITLDSFTRTGDYSSARRAVREGRELNGYPIVTYGAERNRRLVEGLLSADFPIQVRHGTSLPERVFESLIDAGLDATEGGPISYCLPYSRTPLQESIAAWARACGRLAELRNEGIVPHLESFAGCMLGQLCPPSLLVALGILEGLFFQQHGIDSVSLSYAQNTSFDQDLGAILALRQLAEEFLEGSSWHVVVYTFMGKFPVTSYGARRLIEASARLAVRTGSERLIVKTAAEAHQIPTIEDNVKAICWVQRFARTVGPPARKAQAEDHRDQIHAEARCLIGNVLSLDSSLAASLSKAFQKGYLDVPYCLHPDNPNQARSWVDSEGVVRWADPGRLPISRILRREMTQGMGPMGSVELLRALTWNQRKYDQPPKVRQGDSHEQDGTFDDHPIRLS